jgi:hypothetical protein
MVHNMVKGRQYSAYTNAGASIAEMADSRPQISTLQSQRQTRQRSTASEIQIGSGSGTL